MNVWPSDAVLPAFYNQTLREVMRVSLGGSRVRARLTNEFGTAPLAIDAVHLAIAGEDGAIQPSSDRTLTFGGLPAAVIPAGAALLSDPVDLPVAPLTRIAVSVFVRGFMPVHTHHYEAQQTTYVSIPGNFAGATLMPVEQRTTSRYLTTAIFVDAAPAARAVVCFGDSITDGYGSSLDRDARWPDALAERLQAMPGFAEVAVLNAGLGGNRIFHDGRGPKGLARFDRDVLSLPRLSHVVILEGINDIGWPNTILAGPDQVVPAATLIGGLGQLVARGQTAGAKVLLGTLTPFEGTRSDAPVHAFHSAEKEKTRQAVNRWIRTQSLADGMIDFDAVLRDPNTPGRLQSMLDCGDHIHPNDDGYRAMAAAIELGLFE